MPLLSFQAISFSQNVGIGTNSPGFPLNFSSTIGDKISLWGNFGNHYGLSIQPNLLQIHSDMQVSDIAFGHGSSGAFNEVMRIKGNGNVGIGTATPGFPLNFPNTTGDKISLYGNSGNHFGLGVQDYLFQIHAGTSADDIAFGYGSSASFFELVRIKGNGNVGIGTSSPNSNALLHILIADSTKGLLVTGTNNSNPTVPDLGAGSRMMFYPGKTAFRAGKVLLDQWDNANVGFNSVAMGFNTIAKGNMSSAFGSNTSALGIYSFATGASTLAYETGTSAFGIQTRAIGFGSSAFGDATYANGNCSASFGNQNRANGSFSFATGFYNVAKGYCSFVIGRFNDSLLLADQINYSGSSPFFVVGNGSSLTSRSNAMVVWDDGKVEVASLKIGNGTLVNKQQMGAMVVGSNGTSHKTLTIVFASAFSNPPKIIATTSNQAGCSCDDTFAVSVRSISTTSVTFNIHRVDINSGWSQNPELNWTAWEQ